MRRALRFAGLWLALLACGPLWAAGGLQQPGAGGKVQAITAADGTVTVGGTAAAPTIKATVGTASGTVAAGDDSRFPASVTGLRKGAGAGSADTAAVAGTDYLTPTGNGSGLTSLNPANLSAPVAIANGGTGQATALAGFNALLPVYTWALRPSAASNSGSTIKVSDVGTGGGTLFASDGSMWRPSSGCVVLYENSGSIASPLSTITGSTAAQFSIAGGNPSIPANLLATKSVVEVRSMLVKTGANGTASYSIKLGTTGTSSDSAVFAFTLTASSGHIKSHSYVTAKSATSFTTSLWSPENSFQTSLPFVDQSTNIDFTAAQSISANIASANASDTFALISLQVRACP